MTPEQLQAFERALRLKWEAEKQIEVLQAQLLKPEEFRQQPNQVTTPSFDQQQNVPIPQDPAEGMVDGADESKYTRAIVNYFKACPGGISTVEQAISVLGPPEDAGRLRSALVRAGKRGLLIRQGRGIYKLSGANQ